MGNTIDKDASDGDTVEEFVIISLRVVELEFDVKLVDVTNLVGPHFHDLMVGVGIGKAKVDSVVKKGLRVSRDRESNNIRLGPSGFSVSVSSSVGDNSDGHGLVIEVIRFRRIFLGPGGGFKHAVGGFVIGAGEINGT